LQIRRRLVPYLLLAPSFLLFLGIFVYPWSQSLIQSFQYWDHSGSAHPLGTFVGLANYVKLFSNPLFVLALTHTTLFAGLTVTLNILIGLGMAIVFTGANLLRGGKLVRTIYFIPLLSSPVIDGLAWKLLLQQDLGIVNYILGILHISPVGWSSDPNVVLWTVIMVDIWAQCPWIILVFGAGLLTIPASQYEAARLARASAWSLFRHITLPWLSPLILLVAIFRLTGAIRTYEIVFTVIGENGGPNNAMLLLSNYLQTQLFKFYDFGVGSALSWFLLLLTLGFSSVLFLTLYREMKL
jgi:multiple sugar transport system permease protein